MTPEEKAKELTLMYYNLGKHLYVPISFAKQCALIAVDECIKYATLYASQEVSFENSKDFLYQVKQEIEKL